MADNLDWFEKMELQALGKNSETVAWMDHNPAFKGEVQCIAQVDYEHLCKWAENIDNLDGFLWPGPLPTLHPETQEGYVVPWTQLLDSDDEAPELESGELDPDTGEWIQPPKSFMFQRFVFLQAEKVNDSTELDWVQRRVLYIYGDYSRREWLSCAKYWMRTIDGKVDAVGILRGPAFSFDWQTFKSKFNADCRGPLVGLQDGFAPWLSPPPSTPCP